MTIKTVKDLIERLKDLPPNATIGIEDSRNENVEICDVDWGVSKKTDITITFSADSLLVDKEEYENIEGSDYWKDRYCSLRTELEYLLD